MILPCSGEIEEQDPWAGSISCPPPEPAAYVTELMKLSSDTEHRRWFIQDSHTEVAWSQVWGHFQEDNDNEVNHESGVRFQTSYTFITSLLSELKMDLIVEVKIERHRRYSRWERSNNEDIGFIPPSTRLFLIRSDGSISTL
jgi:hypothetical protein